MSNLKTLTASALAIAALTPVAASAADVALRGAPTMRLVDANHATLAFTTDERRRARPTARTASASSSPAPSRRSRRSSHADATATTTRTAHA